MEDLLTGGLEGLAVGAFLVFFVDAVVPIFPEMFALIAFLARPAWESALLIILAATLGEVCGNFLLYRLVKRFGIPRFLKGWIRRYADFLVIKGEKIVLVNRIVPLVPVVGPFITTCHWDLQKTLWYIAIGGVIKNSVLFAVAGGFFSLYEPYWARVLSLSAFAAVMLLSLIAARQKRAALVLHDKG